MNSFNNIIFSRNSAIFLISIYLFTPLMVNYTNLQIFTFFIASFGVLIFIRKEISLTIMVFILSALFTSILNLKQIYLFFGTLLFLFLPLFGEFYLKKFKEIKFDYWFYKFSIELLSLIFGLLLAFAGLIKLYEYLFNLGISEVVIIQTDKIIGIIVTLFLVIYFVHKMFLIMIGSTKYYIESTNTQLSQKRVTFLTILIILILIVAPEAFFAEMYGFISAVFHDKDYAFIDLLYFSFTLHYSIPMDGSLKVFELKSILNEDNLGRFIQFLHIASTKVIELTIFASIGNIIYKRFILNNEKLSED